MSYVYECMASWGVNYNWPWCVIPEDWFNPCSEVVLTAVQGWRPSAELGLVRVEDGQHRHSSSVHFHHLIDQNGARQTQVARGNSCPICEYLSQIDEWTYEGEDG